jgi:hypothetical protein
MVAADLARLRPGCRERRDERGAESPFHQSFHVFLSS